MRLIWLLALYLVYPSEAYLRLKFRHWFPKYEHHWIDASRHCESRLTDYFQDDRSRCDTPCACAADCILQNIPGTIQTNFGSAQVLLGLLPTALMSASPNIEEIAVLSTYRPALAVLVAAGSSSTRVTRLFSALDVCEPINRPASSALQQWARFIARQTRALRIAVQALNYLAVLSAIANDVRTSVYLDLRTISGWR